jgi:hypothetical protein
MSDGLDGFSGRDLPIVELDLIQPTSSDIKGLTDYKTGEETDTVAGLFVDRKNKQSYGKRFTVVPLKIERKRLLWYSDSRLPEDKTKKGRKCWSDDGNTPSEKVQNPVSKSCLTCNQAKYDLVIPMLFLDVERSLELDEPVVFKLESKKSSNPSTLSIIDAVKKRKKPLRDFQFSLSSIKTSNSQGNFCVLTYANIKPVEEDPKLAVLVERAFLEYCDTGIHTVAEAEDEEEAVDQRPPTPAF